MILSILGIALFSSQAAAIWPVPTSYKHGDTVLWFSHDTEFFVDDAIAGNVGSNACQAFLALVSDSNLGSDLQNKQNLHGAVLPSTTGAEPFNEKNGVTGQDIIDFAIQSARETILHRNFQDTWKFHRRGWKEPSPKGNTVHVSHVDIKLLYKDPVNVGKPLAGDIDESYALSLAEDGKATIRANSSIGVARALTTFTQLFYLHTDKSSVYTTLAPVTIFDAPRFQHRGLNLDVSRHFFPVRDILRQIDACAYNKMNRFHLHITDSQSWPLEIPSMPALSAKGANHPDLVYSTHDFAQIQRHGALQGVQVITEIDMPGHTSSIHGAYPELIAAYDKQPDWVNYAAEPPSGTLKLNSTAVAKFLQKLFDDLLPRISPFSNYFHTGGDEVNKLAYTLDDTVKSSDAAVLQPLMQKFVDRNHAQIRKRGLTPIVWEEMLLDWNITLGSDVVVQSWQSDEAVAKIVAKGHKALVGNYKFWYLDCGHGDFLDPSPSTSADAWPYQDYCAPFHNWRAIYSYNPLSHVPPQHQHLILGGETHMWTEQTDATNVDRTVWPRTAAAAEVLWSGALDPETGRNRSFVEASVRLGEMRERLVGLGVGAEPVQMPYCTMDGERCVAP